MSTQGPNRRAHARHPCQLTCSLVNAGGDPLPGEVLNIGMGGACLRVYGTLKAKSFTLRITTATEILTLDARVARNEAPVAGRRDAVFGISFPSDPATQARLRILVDQVRSRSNMGGPRTMGGYWNKP